MIKRLFAVAALMMVGTASAQDRRLVFEVVDVIGEVQKPEITIFITRQNLDTNYELELKESFVPRIVESVDKKPF
ncbi:MAG: hypothetical protein AAFV53_32950 [Myxococcota bacterium]